MAIQLVLQKCMDLRGGKDVTKTNVLSVLGTNWVYRSQNAHTDILNGYGAISQGLWRLVYTGRFNVLNSFKQKN